jgi:transcriptional regulator with XRE-family HTH domain
MYEENFCIKRIRELMAKNDYNPYRLARKSGIALSTLTSMFEKNTDPRVQTIEKICSACDITVAQFFERSSRDLTPDQEALLDLYTNLSPHDKDRLFSYLNFLSSQKADHK